MYLSGESFKRSREGYFGVNKYQNNTRVSAEKGRHESTFIVLSGVPDYFGRNKISSGGDLSHYSSASLY